MNKSKFLWIKEGYTIFGRQGIVGLNVEHLSRRLNKNKSSFYHYFGDMENFQDALLAYHLERAAIIAARGEKCKNMDPDVINLMIATKDDLLFNKQLKLNLQNPAFKKCFDLAFEKITDSFMDKWAITIGLEQQPMLAKLIFYLVIDNFFLQVTYENFTHHWFQNYLTNLRSIMNNMLRTSNKR